MSKRYIHAQHQNERKKARLDISVSDHNFPLSQNSEFNKESHEADNWGDDNDDEILLLASQACEDAYNDSQLPNYSMCMQPGSTSTQNSLAGPSSGKPNITFKKPSFKPTHATTTNLKEKCNRISSPLPGITSKIVSNTHGVTNISKDLIFTDKIFKDQDTDHVYRQLLQLQEENEKLKSENGKLLEKCVTKEGEASILRTQLKTCQVAVDNARLDKIRAQEKLQMEWTEKLTVANSEVHELRTQLDFKNLEIISAKEKCKKLEHSKVKLTQVAVGPSDVSNRNSSLLSDHAIPSKKIKTTSSCVQTEDKAHFLTLNKTNRAEYSALESILPLILEPSVDQHSILDYNEKLQKHTDLTQNRCRLYSTFHRVPSTPAPKGDVARKVTLNSLYGDVTRLVVGGDDVEMQKNYVNIFASISSVLRQVHSQLEAVSQRVTTSFQKEMDERYIEGTAEYIDVRRRDLLTARSLYKEEQDILARRMVATLSYVLESSRGVHEFCKYDATNCEQGDNATRCDGKIMDTIYRICTLLDKNSCATLYSGLLLSIAYLIQQLLTKEIYEKNILELLRTILNSRPMPFVVTKLLGIVRTVSAWNKFLDTFCPGNFAGNLRTDYDQGVLLYKKESCFVQVLLKQMEVGLKCIERQALTQRAVEVARGLIVLSSYVSDSGPDGDKARCDCPLVSVQVMVYALRICSVMLEKQHIRYNADARSDLYQELLAVCRCGAQLLYKGGRAADLGPQLSHYEGHLLEFCELLKSCDNNDIYGNMLSELTGCLQSSPEDMPPSFHRQPWLKSFQSFSLVD